MTESPPSYVGRLVWLEQETGPVLCRYHHDKNGNLAPVEMEEVRPPIKVLMAMKEAEFEAYLERHGIPGRVRDAIKASDAA